MKTSKNFEIIARNYIRRALKQPNMPCFIKRQDKGEQKIVFNQIRAWLKINKIGGFRIMEPYAYIIYED